MSTAVFVAVWLALLVAVLVWESAALLDRDFGDTLSEQVWKLMRTTVGAFVLVSLWFWLTWHFFIEPRFFEQWFLTNWIDDYIIVALGLVAAVFLRRKDD